MKSLKKLSILATTLATMCCTHTQQYHYRDIQPVGDYDVRIRERVLQNLLFLYDNTDVEIPLCLHGRQTHTGTYLIHDIRFPDIYEAKNNSAKYLTRSCNQDSRYIGMVHNHPKGTCFPSPVDAKRFKGESGAELEMIVCHTDTEKDSMKVMVYEKGWLHIRDW